MTVKGQRGAVGCTSDS